MQTKQIFHLNNIKKNKVINTWMVSVKGYELSCSTGIVGQIMV